MYKSLLKIAALFLLMGFARWQVFSLTPMLSGSMAPTLKATIYSQDLVLIDRISLKTRPPTRGEIVHLFLKSPEKAWTYVFKRVTGLPGEQLEIRDSRILIGGKILELPDEFKTLRYTNEGYASPGVLFEIATDSFFVLGDNSSGSYDSRYWGAVKGDEILGRAAMIVWPPTRFGRVFPGMEKEKEGL